MVSNIIAQFNKIYLKLVVKYYTTAIDAFSNQIAVEQKTADWPGMLSIKQETL
jgi:hypothetical protein